MKNSNQLNMFVEFDNQQKKLKSDIVKLHKLIKSIENLIRNFSDCKIQMNFKTFLYHNIEIHRRILKEKKKLLKIQ